MKHFYTNMIILLFASRFDLSKSKTDEFGNRILGGEDCSIQDHPYMLSIHFPSMDLRHRCGGTLIAPNYGLTAAHCFRDQFSEEEYTIVAGVTDMNIIDAWVNNLQKFNASPDFHGLKLYIINIFIHPSYDNSNQYNDIALIQLSTNVTQDDFIKFVTLPDHNEFHNITYERALAIGWGGQKAVDFFLQTASPENKEPSSILQCVELPLIENAECQKYITAFASYILFVSHICTYLSNGTRDACFGDSGGPLIDGDTQIGITSAGWGCGLPEKPALFTRVAYYRNWIQSVMDEYHPPYIHRRTFDSSAASKKYGFSITFGIDLIIKIMSLF